MYCHPFFHSHLLVDPSLPPAFMGRLARALRDATASSSFAVSTSRHTRSKDSDPLPPLIQLVGARVPTAYHLLLSRHASSLLEAADTLETDVSYQFVALRRFAMLVISVPLSDLRRNTFRYLGVRLEWS